MKLVKSIAFLGLLFSASACQAKSQNYMDCEWSIPAGFHQNDEREYRNSVDEDDLENWTPAFIMFTTYTESELDHYQNVSKSEEGDVLLLAHTAQPGDRFNYVSSFVRRESFGTPFTVAVLRIIKDDKMVVFSGLSKEDAIAMTSGCAEFSKVEKHYDVRQQVENGFSDFLNSAHDMQVLVPE